ncbi:tetratricopeptide repeat protein [Alkalicella caledoniensis]|uniref:Tetratricopeptide repeat protein n=1 Tax=Alkalicella caledoniensis TaxID=2731377 RepID=A0A7G9WAB3_ALKCA|nr:tetratricopeptide repeat protein [Alkalicella caledoniensis]QNO15625.1 tetratricopeptide repeat protein [Alkalicella caledoniensis]
MEELILFSIVNTIFILKKRNQSISTYFSFLWNIAFCFFLYQLYVVTQVSYLLYASGFCYIAIVVALIFPNWQFRLFLLASDFSVNVRLLSLRILARKKESDDLLEKIVVLLNLTERYNQALFWSKKLLVLKKTTKTLNHTLYSLLRLQKYQEANETVDEILVTNHNNNYFLSIKADILFHLKEFEESITYYDRLLEFKPNSPEILYNKGKAYAFLEEFIKAEMCYKESLSANPLFIPAYTSLIKLYLKLNLKDNAAKVLEDIKNAVPNMSKELKKEISSLYGELDQIS